MSKMVMFCGGNVADVRTGKIREGLDVLCADGKIKAVGKGLTGEGAEKIDCRGKFVMPGVIDAHVHITWNGSSDPVGLDEREGVYQAMVRGLNHARDSLKAGVTTVRDTGSMGDVAVEVAYVPNIGVIADTDGELIREIREKKLLLTEKEIPCQWIKIMATGGAAGMEEVGPSMYSQEQLQLIVGEAHRLHMKVAAHAVSREGIVECIKAGIDTIEHGADIPDEYLRMMKDKGLTLVPTLAIYKVLAESYGIVPDRMVAKSKAVTENQKSTFARAREMGVRIALGTDSGSPNFGPQPAAFQEMLTMEEYGMPSAEVIRSATLTAAEVLGLEEQIGSLDEGKTADVLILSENPYERLQAFTEALEAVYQAGVLVD